MRWRWARTRWPSRSARPSPADPRPGAAVSLLRVPRGGSTVVDDTAVGLTAQLVQVPSVNPPGDGEGAVAEIMRARLDRAGLQTRIVTSPAGRPSLVGRLPGPTDRAPLVLLSHTDVVPVEADGWTHDPFGGEVIDGELWGRGTLDMKGVAALHVQAAVALATHGGDVARELIVVGVADEEAGGAQGAEWLVREHPDLVGFSDPGGAPQVLGEGAFGLSGVVHRPIAPIAVGEKSPLGVRARAVGDPAHGSRPPRHQAIRALAGFVDEVAGHRPARVHPVMREHFGALADASQGSQRRFFALLASPAGSAVVRTLAGPIRDRLGVLGNVLSDTITPTGFQAGYKFNVVPGSAHATFDCRLLPDTDADATLSWLRRVGRDRGVEIDEVHRWGGPVSPRGALFDVLAEVSAALPSRPLPLPALSPGTTDLRFFRAAGASAYGWVPLVIRPEVAATFHGNDERVPVDGLLHAERAMTEVVRRVCAAPRPAATARSDGAAPSDR